METYRSGHNELDSKSCRPYSTWPRSPLIWLGFRFIYAFGKLNIYAFSNTLLYLREQVFERYGGVLKWWRGVTRKRVGHFSAWPRNPLILLGFRFIYAFGKLNIYAFSNTLLYLREQVFERYGGVLKWWRGVTRKRVGHFSAWPRNPLILLGFRFIYAFSQLNIYGFSNTF